MYCIQTYPMSAFASCTHCTLWDLWAFVACRNDLAVCFQIKISMRFYKSKGNICTKHELENHRELGFLLQWMSVTLSSSSALRALVTILCLRLERCKLGLEGNLTQETRKHSGSKNTSCWAHGTHGYHAKYLYEVQSLYIAKYIKYRKNQR